jgi:hypothetical protein
VVAQGQKIDKLKLKLAGIVTKLKTDVVEVDSTK